MNKMKLSSNEFKILNYLFKAHFGLIALDANNDYIAAKFNMGSNHVKAITDHLLKEGLIEKWDNDKHFKITGKGQEAINDYIQSRKSKIIWNLLVPIIVSIVTTEITLFLNKY